MDKETFSTLVHEQQRQLYRIAVSYTASSADAEDAMQERLIALGYLSESSGVYDERTAAALKAFQESNGLPADGIAGPNTQQALYAADAIPKS